MQSCDTEDAALTSLNEVELTQFPSVGQGARDSGTTAPATETPPTDASKPAAAAAIASLRDVGFDGCGHAKSRVISVGRVRIGRNLIGSA